MFSTLVPMYCTECGVGIGMSLGKAPMFWCKTCAQAMIHAVYTELPALRTVNDGKGYWPRLQQHFNICNIQLDCNVHNWNDVMKYLELDTGEVVCYPRTKDTDTNEPDKETS